MNKPSITTLDAGTLYTPTECLSQVRIFVEDGIVTAINSIGSSPLFPGAQSIDARNEIVCPGFIDPHIHGCGGVDVMDGTYQSLNTVSRVVARYGTTCFLPTTISAAQEPLRFAIEGIAKLLPRDFDGAQPVGLHLEGPFISFQKRGVHKESHIASARPEHLSEWIRAAPSAIRLVTIAPEHPSAVEIREICAASAIRVGMGHSNASIDEARQAADLGIHYAVHTFNAMREWNHREPGIVGQVLSDDRIFAEIIADGIHVHPAIVRLFSRCKPADRILLATDAISAMDMPDGCYLLGTDTVTVRNGVCRDYEGRLAGSTLNQETALHNFMEWSGFSLQRVLQALTANPARALGLTGRGVVAVGARADFAVLDSNFRVRKTIVGGTLVYETR